MTTLRNVLIVEDDVSWREILRDLLKPAGYIPNFAKNYAEASSLILQQGAWFAGLNLSLCIVDLRLDSENQQNFEGLCLLAMCKVMQIPAIVNTGLMVENMENQLRQFGASAWFFKDTFDPGEFLRAVQASTETAGPSELEAMKSTVLSAADREAFETLMLRIKDLVTNAYDEAITRINTKNRGNRNALEDEWTSEDDAAWKVELAQLEEKRKALMERANVANSPEELQALIPIINREIMSL